jgi:hypothetical protein
MSETQKPAEPLIVRSKSVRPDVEPDVEGIKEVELKDGPRVRKLARYTSIRSRHSGQFHHNALVLETIKKSKGLLVRNDKHTIALSDEDGDEIQRLIDFLAVTHQGALPKTASEYVVMPADRIGTKLQLLLREATLNGKVDVLVEVLRRATEDSGIFKVLLERAEKDPEVFTRAAAALNLGIYRKAVQELESLINTPRVKEEKFQSHLTKHPWMFGSEYSEILERRRWTRDENQDFVVRRTTDEYIELIEIKTPLDGAALFNLDKSHDSYYPAADLSKVLGQVEKYIEKLDGDRHAILANDKEDTNKIRAKIIIGRDGDESQTKALRRHNGHLQRIEVMTFDQLLRVAKNVLHYLETAIETNAAQ